MTNELMALAEADPFEDAVEATTFLAMVHLLHGELALPSRIREHLADGDVVVHLLRGEDDVAVHTATLTSRSTLTGIVWPEDVKPRTSLIVLCPRGSQSHDVAVRLPDLPEPLHYAYTKADREAAPVADEVDPIDLVETSVAGELDIADDGLCSKCPAPAVDDPYFTEPLCGQHLTEAYDAEADEEDGPTDDGSWDTTPTWPGDDELAPEEMTDLLPVVVPEVEEDEPEPGTVYSAALVAVRTPPPKPGWLERRLRLAARLVLAESQTATRVAVAIASTLVLSGAGLAYLVLAVAS